MAKKARRGKKGTRGGSSKTSKSRAAKASRKAAPKRSKSKTARPAGTSRKVVRPEAKVPNAIGLKSQHLDFLTLRMDQVKKFYTDILGFQSYRQESKLNYLVIRTTSGSSLGFMPPNPRMLGEQPPPREGTLYFMVEDVDKVYAKLVAKGLGFLGPPREMPWGHRVITTTDPEGRTVMLGSELDAE